MTSKTKMIIFGHEGRVCEFVPAVRQRTNIFEMAVKPGTRIQLEQRPNGKWIAGLWRNDDFVGPLMGTRGRIERVSPTAIARLAVARWVKA
jgi:hypothetical protein